MAVAPDCVAGQSLVVQFTLQKIMKKQPNFLYIMTDQHRADWLGCYGHPTVRTPNIDALANAGTRFDQFFVASPVCMPNRASFMTGRYPSVHGLRYNGCLLSEKTNTFIDVLRAGGYRTASIGKSHLQPMTDKAPFAQNKFDAGPIAEAWKSADSAHDNEQPAQYEQDKRYNFTLPYYGYDHVDMVTGHGDQAGGHYRQWFRQQHSNWRELTDRQHQLPHNYTCPQAFRTPIPEESYPTFFVRDCAKEYLRNATADSTPFFSFVSFPDPHHPFNPPGKYWDMYSPDDFDLPIQFSDHKNPPPPLLDAKANFDRGELPAVPQITFMASEQHIREAMALTAGMITMIDDAVGEIVQTLKETGQYDNTIIIFNSDHGDYLGDYGLMLKGAWPRDGITRVPMIWSDPQDRQTRVTQTLASTVDIAPTILERAGIRPYHGMQGESFASAISGGSGHRDELMIEFNDGGSRMGFTTPARVRVLVNDQWHLALYKGEAWGELYDRKQDPQHLENLWHSVAHSEIKAQLVLDLSHHLIGQMDESPRSTLLA